jgi:multidrug resistance efflux pump
MKTNKNAAEAAMNAAKDEFDLAAQALLEADPGDANWDDLVVARDNAQAAYLAKQAAFQSAENAYDDMLDSYETQYNQLTQGLDQAEIGLDSAQKAYDLTTGEAYEDMVTQANAQLDQAKAGYQAALKQLSYTKVTSPIDGVIEQKLVSENGISSQASPAYVVSNKDTLCVNFNVSADIARAMKTGDGVTVEYGQKSYPAEIIESATL